MLYVDSVGGSEVSCTIGWILSICLTGMCFKDSNRSGHILSSLDRKGWVLFRIEGGMEQHTFCACLGALVNLPIVRFCHQIG